MKTKKNIFLSALLCLAVFAGFMPVTLRAETADIAEFGFTTTAKVVQTGSEAPSNETFNFEVIDSENEKELSDYGITMKDLSIDTTGAGEYKKELKGEIDFRKVTKENGWRKIIDTGNAYYQVFELRELDSGNAGWLYSKETYNLQVNCNTEEKTVDTTLYLGGTDVYLPEAVFTNNYAGKPSFTFEIKKEVIQDGTEAPGNETFTFELVDNKDNQPLSSYGITVGDIKIDTQGEGVYTQTFTGTIDSSKVNKENGWALLMEAEPAYYRSFELKEVNEGKEDWYYSQEHYHLQVFCNVEEETASVNIFSWGTDVGIEQAEFINSFYRMMRPVTVKKVDEADKPLKGAVFTLTGQDNSVGKNYEAVSGEDGMAQFDVPEGFYLLEEKTAPEGYIRSDQTYRIAVLSDGVFFYHEPDQSEESERFTEYETVKIVNKRVVPEPEKPEPEKPEPEKPEPQKPEPEKPAPQKPAPAVQKAAAPAPVSVWQPAISPKTGDENNNILWITAGIVSLCVIFAVAIVQLNKKKNSK